MVNTGTLVDEHCSKKTWREVKPLQVQLSNGDPWPYGPCPPASTKALQPPISAPPWAWASVSSLTSWWGSGWSCCPGVPNNQTTFSPNGSPSQISSSAWSLLKPTMGLTQPRPSLLHSLDIPVNASLQLLVPVVSPFPAHFPRPPQLTNKMAWSHRQCSLGYESPHHASQPTSFCKQLYYGRKKHCSLNQRAQVQFSNPTIYKLVGI